LSVYVVSDALGVMVHRFIVQVKDMGLSRALCVSAVAGFLGEDERRATSAMVVELEEGSVKGAHSKCVG
jgi:hypothetical protein